MQNCFQTENQSVYQHGLTVWKHTQRLLNQEWENFILPDWFKDNFDTIKRNIFDESIIEEYNIYHDCGKPFCLTIDEDGNRHFPDHAQISSDIWSKVSTNKNVIQLIALDMILHSETALQITERKLPHIVLFTLLVTAFSEIHSNAVMFGGIDSLSFKIKYKKLCKRGKMIMRGFNDE